MSTYKEILIRINQSPKVWLITGVAGFIGSNLLETLLKNNQKVVGLDDFSTGYQHNLDEVRSLVTTETWQNFQFIEGDIRALGDCEKACSGVDFVLHQAALGSVPRSINDPITTNETNISGFLNMLVAAKDARVNRFVYAASSSTYGDHPDLPKVENTIGKPLSPYAVTKLVNELYADVFDKTYGFKSIGLRYFNIFGKRQDPNGAYAAVIPKWVDAIINGNDVVINGDGETSRDFCYIENAVQANILAAVASDNVSGNVFNIAVGERTTLNKLFELIKERLSKELVGLHNIKPLYSEFREGDVRHSLADISKAKELLGYEPSHTIRAGIPDAIGWYMSICSNEKF